jgi:hypothetical protein
MGTGVKAASATGGASRGAACQRRLRGPGGAETQQVNSSCWRTTSIRESHLPEWSRMPLRSDRGSQHAARNELQNGGNAWYQVPTDTYLMRWLFNEEHAVRYELGDAYSGFAAS